MHLFVYCTLTTTWFLALSADSRKLVDLTHTLDENAPKWPLWDLLSTNEYFQMRKLFWGQREHYWAAINKVEFYEHMGTHIDAPIFLSEGRQTVDEIPVDKLMGPGVVFDIKTKAKENPDYGLTVADIEDYEAEFGRIPDGAITLLNSGWAVKYPKPEAVFGTKSINDSTTFHFPGYTIEAAEFLLTKRNVKVVGSDTPSIDLAIDIKLQAHVYLQAYNVPLLQYVANLDTIPQTGTTIFLGAPKFRNGTGGPTRVMAVLEDDVIKSSGDRLSSEVTAKMAFFCLSVVCVQGFCLEYIV